MKLRVTKGRIACAVVLMPVLHFLSLGPACYCVRHHGLNSTVVNVVYGLSFQAIGKTPLAETYYDYLRWWCPDPDGTTIR